MPKNLRFALGLTFLFIIVALALSLRVIVGMNMNPLTGAEPVPVSAHVEQFHQQLLVADLHADTLLWSREPDAPGRWGHTDFPRMRQGNLALQAFSVVTKAPRGLNLTSNDADSDNITLLAIAEFWPPATWSSLLARAVYQAQRLDAADRRDPDFHLIHSRQELAAFIREREENPNLVAGWLTLEGAHALEGNVDNIDRLYEAGFRMIGIAHFFDNEIGGSAHGTRQHGLTTRGVAFLRRMEEKSMIVDLAHASDQTVDDVLTLSNRPVMVSHTGLNGVCPNERNLSDVTAKRIADKGGLIGIGFWEVATCGQDVGSIVKAIDYAVKLVGIDHVALGSDFDGAIASPITAAGVVQITEALVDIGYSETAIRKIMGENVFRFLEENLPPV